MFITQRALPRRTFLRGVGATLALPFLDAMVPALSAMTSATAPVKRLGFVYIPMGSAAAYWTPKAEGHITELSPILTPLTPFIDQVTVVSNLEHKNAYSTGNHATANCTFLSGVKAKLTEGSDYEMGITADQIAAKHLGGDTPLPSLELATDFNYVVGNCDNGYACVYMKVFATSFKGDGKNASALIVAELTGDSLKFREDKGTFVDSIRFSAAAVDTNGVIAQVDNGTVSLAVKPEVRQQIAKNGVRLLARIALSPGRYQVRVAAADSGGGAASVVHYDLDVPDYTKAAIAMTIERRTQFGGVEVLAAAGHRRNADPGLVEHVLEHLRRLREVVLQFVPPRFDAVKAVACRHFDARFGMRLQRREHVTAHRPSELVAGQGKALGGGGDADAGIDEFASIQQGDAPFVSTHITASSRAGS